MVNLLRSQAKDDRFPFEFRDYSVKEPFESKWKSEVRNLISMSSAVIVAIGLNTYNRTPQAGLKRLASPPLGLSCMRPLRNIKHRLVRHDPGP